MKRNFLLIVFCCSFVFSVSVDAKDFFKSKPSVSVKYVDAAQIKASNVSSSSSKKKWLRIDVEYVTVSEKTKNGRYRWEDDVLVKFAVLYPTLSKNKKTVVFMTGQVKFWSICKDGKKHRVVAFVPPQLLERYAISAKTKFGSRDAQKTLYAKVMFFNGKDKKISTSYAYPSRKSSKSKAANLFKKRAKSSNIKKLNNSILARKDTPWAHLQLDLYDLIKRTGDN